MCSLDAGTSTPKKGIRALPVSTLRTFARFSQPSSSMLRFAPHTFSSLSYELACSWTLSNFTTTSYPRCHSTPSCKSTSQTLRTCVGPLTRQDSSASMVISSSPKQTTSTFASFASNTTIRFRVIMGKAVHSTSSDVNTHGQEYVLKSRVHLAKIRC